MTNFLVEEFENLEDILVDERGNNINLNKKMVQLQNKHAILIKYHQSKKHEEILKNSEIENLVNQLINVNNTKEILVESNKKLNEKLKKVTKDFDDCKKKEVNTKNKLIAKLNDEILKNKELTDIVAILEKELKEKNKKIEDLRGINKNLENELENEKKEYADYKFVTAGDIDKLNKKIDELKKKLEKWITLTFSSRNGYINDYAIKCKNLDEFQTIKEKLYAAFPNLKNKNYIFIVNGHTIDESKTLEENNINSDASIIINPIDTTMMNQHY